VVNKRDMGKLRFLVLREDGARPPAVVPGQGARRAAASSSSCSTPATGSAPRARCWSRSAASCRSSPTSRCWQGAAPIPSDWYGLTDTEQRFRQRELDLVVNPEARRVFEVRAKVLRSLRAEMEERGFVEVETPMLHPIPGGATAKPFVTHHNALDTDLYLRIAPELYLKRLIAGGMRRVFEINRSFRNEGMSTRHNPEFTMLESYEAYADYHDVMDLTEALLQRAAPTRSAPPS
jgi:lysyl-tRNA synthetase, class II